MGNLPTKLPFDWSAIRAIKSVDDVRQFLTNFSRDFDKLYGKMHDAFIGNIVAESRNYRIIESGDDLIIEYFNGSQWTDTGWKLEKPV